MKRVVLVMVMVMVMALLLVALVPQTVLAIDGGDLEVTKIVDWNGATPDTSQSFEICITGPSFPNGDCQTIDYNGGTALTVDSTVNELIEIPEIQAILEAMWGGLYGAAVAQGGDTAFHEVAYGFVNYGIFTTAEVDAFVAEVEAALALIGGPLIWTGLIPGEYIVTEIDPGSMWMVSISGSPAIVDLNGPAQVEVTNELMGTDFGDAPDSYGTLLASNGARHVIGGPWLGPLPPDAEPDGQPTSDATGDDVNVADDEDVLSGPVIVYIGEPSSGSIEIGGTGGYLQAWIDLNQDGVWQHPEEQTSTAYFPAPGVYQYSNTEPLNGPEGPTYMRIRISSQGGLLPTGMAPDGEVEDYEILLVNRDDGSESISGMTGWGIGLTVAALTGTAVLLLRRRQVSPI